MDFQAPNNHKKWQLLLIPSVSLFASLLILLSTSNGKTQLYFPWKTFISISVFTYAIWQVNLIPYRILDKRMAFYEQPGKRLLAQIFLCLLATWSTFTVLYVLLTVIESGSLQKIFNSGYILFLLIATGISLIINSLYVIRYLQATVLYKEAISTKKINDLLIQLEQQTQNNKELPNEAFADTSQTNSLLIASGNKTFPVPFAEMAYWFSSSKLVTLVLTDGKKITTNFSSFTSLTNQLPKNQFFQLNRQFIVHVQSIASIHDDENGKLTVELNTRNGSTKKEMVTVSRYRSRELKTWFADILTPAQSIPTNTIGANIPTIRAKSV